MITRLDVSRSAIQAIPLLETSESLQNSKDVRLAQLATDDDSNFY